jgi:hypothetical protein
MEWNIGNNIEICHEKERNINCDYLVFPKHQLESNPKIVVKDNNESFLGKKVLRFDKESKDIVFKKKK